MEGGCGGPVDHRHAPLWRPHTLSPSPTLDLGTGAAILLLAVQKGHTLQVEVDRMLKEDSVEIVQDRVLTFYSILFLVEKTSGEWRPGIALSPLLTRVWCFSASGWRL